MVARLFKVVESFINRLLLGRELEIEDISWKIPAEVFPAGKQSPLGVCAKTYGSVLKTTVECDQPGDGEGRGLDGAHSLTSPSPRHVIWAAHNGNVCMSIVLTGCNRTKAHCGHKGQPRREFKTNRFH